MEKKATRTRKPGKKWILFTGIALVLVGAAVFIGLPKLQANAASTTTSYTTQAAEVGDLSTVISATGNVYTKQSVSLNWKTSGIVGTVYVTKGQEVTAGMVLAELDPSSLSQDVLNASTDLATAQQALDDLLNSDSARAAAELALVEAEQAYVSAQSDADSLLYLQASQQNIDIYYAELINAREALEKAEENFTKVSGYATDDLQYVNKLSALATAQQDYYTAQSNYESVTSMASTDDIALANATLDVAEATYLDAKRTWEAVKDGPSETDIATAEANVAAAQAVLDEAYIYASISGTVTEIDTQVGDLVSSSTLAFQVDDLSQLLVDVSVSELDIAQVSVGQPVSIIFDAISDKTYTGEVYDIATEGTNSANSVNFDVTVVITNPDSDIKPGMTATADIVISDISDAILVPSSAIRTVDSQKTVYLLQNGALVPVAITVGEVGDTQTQVTSGNINAGDLIVLNPTTATSSETTTSTSLFSSLFSGLLGGSSSTTTNGGNSMPSGGGPSGEMPSGEIPSGGSAPDMGAGN